MKHGRDYQINSDDYSFLPNLNIELTGELVNLSKSFCSDQKGRKSPKLEFCKKFEEENFFLKYSKKTLDIMKNIDSLATDLSSYNTSKLPLCIASQSSNDTKKYMSGQLHQYQTNQNIFSLKRSRSEYSSNIAASLILDHSHSKMTDSMCDASNLSSFSLSSQKSGYFQQNSITKELFSNNSEKKYQVVNKNMQNDIIIQSTQKFCKQEKENYYFKDNLNSSLFDDSIDLNTSQGQKNIKNQTYLRSFETKFLLKEKPPFLYKRKTVFVQQTSVSKQVSYCMTFCTRCFEPEHKGSVCQWQEPKEEISIMPSPQITNPIVETEILSDDNLRLILMKTYDTQRASLTEWKEDIEKKYLISVNVEDIKKILKKDLAKLSNYHDNQYKIYKQLYSNI